MVLLKRVAVKEYKIPNQWSSAVPKKYKKNTIPRDLHRAHKTSNNFELEKQLIKKKNLSVSFPYSYIQSFQEKGELSISNWFFEEKHRKAVHIRIHFYQSNEHYALKFIRKWESCAKENYSFVTIWKIRNIRSLFNLKDKASHVSFVVYEERCNRGKYHVGKTGLNDEQS